KLNGDTGLKTNKEPVDQEDQAFLEELERHKRQKKEADDAAESLRKTFAKSKEDLLLQTGATRASSTNNVNTTSTPVNTASTPVNTANPSRNVSVAGPSYLDLLTYANQDDSQIPSLEDIYEVPNDGIFTRTSYDYEGTVADFTNSESTMNIEPKKISQALEVESWVDAMQEELLQFKTQQVWILVNLPFGKKVIRTKWVYMNKKDERGVVVRNKARMVAQGHRQEEGIDYDKVFAHMARIEAIEIFLAFASYMGFIVYQMDMKVPSCIAKLTRRCFVWFTPSFQSLVCYFIYFSDAKWIQKRTHNKTLFIKKDNNDIILDKYVAEILKKFDFISVKTASTPIETKKPLVKDAEAADVDVHLSLMYLTASRPDIMYAVCACSRFQVTPKTSHLHAVKMIFRYFKGQPKLGLWYPRESSFDLEAYSYSDYARANLDRKSTTGEGVSAAGETLNAATLIVNTVNFSNMLMADSLPKTIWLSMHHVIANEALAIPEQTATGKETSNSFMAGRMLKMPKYQISSSSSKRRLENNKVFEYILQVIKTPKLKKHEVMLHEVTAGEEERRRQY
nr:hypothetical protein [Tanacetum cinerariifolium]